MTLTLLERYARWKSRRFDLSALPSDVLFHLCADFLSYEDIVRLGVAFDPGISLFSVDNFPLSLPIGMRTQWLLSASLSHLYEELFSLRETCIFYCGQRFVALYAFLDWSPFSNTALQPACMYTWGAEEKCGFLHWKMESVIDDNTIERAVSRCGMDGRYEVHISVYGCHGIRDNGEPDFYLERPVFTTSARLFPSFIDLTRSKKKGGGRMSAIANLHTFS